MRARHLAPVAALLLVPALAACGDDDPAEVSSVPTPTESTPTVSEEPTEASSSAATQTTDAAPVLPGACDLITVDDVAKAMGVSFGAGEPETEDESEGSLAWTADECSFDADDLVEVSIRVTQPGDFVQGTFTCPMPSDRDGVVEPVDDVAGASEGWWKVSNPPNFAGTLRACTPEVFVEVELDYEDGVDYEGDPRQQAGQLAQLVLANLQA